MCFKNLNFIATFAKNSNFGQKWQFRQGIIFLVKIEILVKNGSFDK